MDAADERRMDLAIDRENLIDDMKALQEELASLEKEGERGNVEEEEEGASKEEEVKEYRRDIAIKASLLEEVRMKEWVSAELLVNYWRLFVCSAGSTRRVVLFPYA